MAGRPGRSNKPRVPGKHRMERFPSFLPLRLCHCQGGTILIPRPAGEVPAPAANFPRAWHWAAWVTQCQKQCGSFYFIPHERLPRRARLSLLHCATAGTETCVQRGMQREASDSDKDGFAV